MIDTACILFSALVCLFMAFRALQLDRTMEWFSRALPMIRAAGTAFLPSLGTARARPAAEKREPVAVEKPVAPPAGWRGRAQTAPPGAAAPSGWRDRKPASAVRQGRPHAS